jgi:GNAT superfamily N-acetyltransferase
LSKNNPDQLSVVEPLAKNHQLEGFDCGKHHSLTEWLQKFAFSSQQSNSARTFVVHRANRVVGYYSLSASSILKEEASERAAKGQAAYPIPVILLARLAIDKTEQKQGIGPALLKNALQRSFAASKEIGARALLVHAIDEEAKSFYRHYGFEDCAVNDLHLMLLMKDVAATQGLPAV